MAASLLTTVSVRTTPAQAVAGFGDVSPDRFYTEAVQWMVNATPAITTGTSRTCFSPDGLVTRGDAGVFMWRMEGRPHGGSHSFTDVSKAYQDEAIAWMANSSPPITTGTSSTTFEPDRPLTRGEFAALLYRLDTVLGRDPDASVSHLFTDVIRPWQQDPVSWMANTSPVITTGTSSRTFSPDRAVNRAELATFLWRYKGRPAQAIDPTHPTEPTCDQQVPTPSTTSTTTTTVAPAPRPGDLDTTFGSVGAVVADWDLGYDIAYAVTVQADGKILVAGFSDRNADTNSSVLRLLPNGARDGLFGDDGFVSIDLIDDGPESAYDIVSDAEGRIVIGGFADSDAFVARLLSDGTLDPTFGDSGATVVPEMDGNAGGGEPQLGLAIAADGSIYASGGYGPGRVVRITSGGEVDASFGVNGIATAADMTEVYDLALQPDGKIVLAGSTNGAGGYSDFAIARFGVNGEPDETFSSGGMAATPIGLRRDSALAVEVQPDGKIIAGGLSNNLSDNDFALARYLSDGSLDPSFSGGTVTTDFGGGSHQILGLALYADGRIAAVGRGTFSGGHVSVYETDGSLDTNFGSSGWVTFDAINIDQLQSIAIQPDGMILVAGDTRISGSPGYASIDYLVMRLRG